jgi:hypothetical protein
MRYPRQTGGPMERPELVTHAGTAALWRFPKRGSNRAANLAFAALRVAGLGIVLGFTAAQAGGLAFDAAGNLFVADGHSIFKYLPDVLPQGLGIRLVCASMTKAICLSRTGW